MKNILIVAFFLALTYFSQAQTIIVKDGELAFLQKGVTLVNFKVDMSKTTVNSFKSIDEWVNFRYNEIKLKDGAEDAGDWKRDWEAGLADALSEFRDDFNVQMERSPVRLKEGAAVDYTATLIVEKLSVPEGFGNKPVELVGRLVFSKGGTVLSTVEIVTVKGFPTGGLSMRVKSAFRRAGGHTGEKIFLMYF